MRSGFSGIFKLATGILVLIVNLGIWINGMILNIEKGLDTIWSILLLPAGAFMLLGWYKNSGAGRGLKHRKWKFVLTALLVNYAVLYLLYIISDQLYHDAIDLLSLPGIILPILLGIFVIGFILSWKNELHSGMFFLMWYGLVLYGSFRYGEIMARGPHIQFGIVILIQGIFYIIYHIWIKPAELK